MEEPKKILVVADDIDYQIYDLKDKLDIDDLFEYLSALSELNNSSVHIYELKEIEIDISSLMNIKSDSSSDTLKSYKEVKIEDIKEKNKEIEEKQEIKNIVKDLNKSCPDMEIKNGDLFLIIPPSGESYKIMVIFNKDPYLLYENRATIFIDLNKGLIDYSYCIRYRKDLKKIYETADIVYLKNINDED